MTGMLENTKIQGFLVRLDTPGNGMIGFDIDPTE